MRHSFCLDEDSFRKPGLVSLCVFENAVPRGKFLFVPAEARFSHPPDFLSSQLTFFDLLQR